MRKLVALFLLPLYGFSQQPSGAAACAEVKQNLAEKRLLYTKNAKIAYPGDATIDVNYYKLELAINPTAKSLSSVVTIKFTTLQDLATCFFDLNSSFSVSAVQVIENEIAVAAEKPTFEHSSNLVALKFPKTYKKGENVTVKITYSGKPPSNNSGSFEFGTHGSQAFPVIWSLSEPYGAPDWWVCKDNPNDKADSSDVWITMPSAFVSVSNGKLTAVLDNGSSKTYKWKNRYPIAHYLISVACSNYEQYDNYFKYSEKDSLLVSHYLYPESLTATTKAQLNETVNALNVFSKIYGEYPFIKEKYGHAQCGFGGGMEHQTCSSMGEFNTGLIAHELAHQWFGDKVTCKTWADIWVNEGFATFSEAIYTENTQGKAAYQKEIANDMTQAKQATGSIFVQNTSSIGQIFNFNRTYAKGSVVLHMLRGVLGDDTFFLTLRNYLKQYAQSVASVRDFQAVAEATSGKKLDYFFNEWLFGTGYPAYNFGWQKENTKGAKITVNQQVVNGSELFKMPVQLQFRLANNKDTTVVVNVDAEKQTFVFDSFAAEVTNVVFDPDNLILKDLTVDLNVTAIAPSIEELVLYPNPTANELNLRGSEILETTQIVIYDTNGRAFTDVKRRGNVLHVGTLPAGKYWLSLQNNERKFAKAFVKL